MNDLTLDPLSTRLAWLAGESSRRSSQAHADFLRQREASLKQIAHLVELSMLASLPAALDHHPARPGRPSILFDERQLSEFGTGKLSRCFGPSFARYDGRLVPRIPNGDLSMMSRVVEIQGHPGDFHYPAETVVEYDVPQDAWYFSAVGSGELPYFLLMEAALQPCGFLSVYLDTYALVPYESFYFRNLDGMARVTAAVDVRGKTLTTRARLVSSVVSGGTVIQKFSFSVACAGTEIYQGDSTFGYFAAEAMASQVGLDHGQPVQPWFRLHPDERLAVIALQQGGGADGWLASLLPTGRLRCLDQASFSSTGGKYRLGYLYGLRKNDPQDWFYPYHFHGDSVMPGSLGVEAVLEALKLYSLAQASGGGKWRPFSFRLPAGERGMSWRYRGQITPQNKLMELEVHLSDLQQRKGGLTISGDASVWVDGLRIYEVKNAALQIQEGNG